MIYIRADMNGTVATGHVMRCMAIADAAKTMGEETTFILADSQAEELLEARGFQYMILDTPWNAMEQELPVLEKRIKDHQIKSILIDSYQVTERYLAQLSALTKTIYIDDTDAFTYPVNALICYAIYCQKFHYPERYPDTKLLLGPKYTPLRGVFSCQPPKTLQKQAKNLLLMSGGSDPFGFLPKLLVVLGEEGFERIDVICGMYSAQFQILQEKYASCPQIRLHQAVRDIECYMAYADLAISAGGTTLYELCAMGTPAISYSMADNQLDNVTMFQAQNRIDYAGDIRKDADGVIRNILHYISVFREQPGLREQRSRSMQKFVDGKGAFRIASAIRCI